MLRKILSSLSAYGWDCVPALLVVWPEASQRWSQQPVGWGQILVRKWWPPGGLTPISVPRTAVISLFCHNESQLPPTFARDLLILVMSLLFSLYSGTHKTVCAPSKSGVSFPHPIVEFLQSNPADLQSQILWGFFLLPDPQAGESDVGLRTFTPIGELL